MNAKSLKLLRIGALVLGWLLVAGVLVSSLLHRENLVRAMIDGYKWGEPGQGIRRMRWLVGIGLIFGVAALWSKLI